jgi:hypothetical protein
MLDVSKLDGGVRAFDSRGVGSTFSPWLHGPSNLEGNPAGRGQQTYPDGSMNPHCIYLKTNH